MVYQFLVGPVGTVQPLLGWPLDDPAADLVGQGVGDLGRGPLGLPRLQGVQSAVAVGVEPAGHAAAVDAEVSGDVLSWSSAVRHEDDLHAVTQLAVRGA